MRAETFSLDGDSDHITLFDSQSHQCEDAFGVCAAVALR